MVAFIPHHHFLAFRFMYITNHVRPIMWLWKWRKSLNCFITLCFNFFSFTIASCNCHAQNTSLTGLPWILDPCRIGMMSRKSVSSSTGVCSLYQVLDQNGFGATGLMTKTLTVLNLWKTITNQTSLMRTLQRNSRQNFTTLISGLRSSMLQGQGITRSKKWALWRIFCGMAYYFFLSLYFPTPSFEYYVEFIFLYILQHPLVRIMCSCTHQEKYDRRKLKWV